MPKDYDPVKGTIYTLPSGDSYYTKLRPNHEGNGNYQGASSPHADHNRNRFNSNHHVRLQDNEIFDIQKLKEFFLREGRLTNIQTMLILDEVMRVFKQEENLLQIKKMPINIIGDIHGQFYDLMKLFEVGGNLEETNYLFLGDYVDRGIYSVETLLFLYVLKINYPNKMFMLRGNHECKHLTTYFTFKSEVLHKYHSNNFNNPQKRYSSVQIYKHFCLSFNYLPLAALLNEQYFCVHGGISPHLKQISDINTNIPDRFKEVPSDGLMCDLLWSDPLEDYDTFLDDSNELFIDNNQRGCSYMYTFKAVELFLQRNNILCIIRAHEAQDLGYRMYKNSSALNFPSLITIFSAPNYLDSYNNKGALLKFVNNTMNIRQFNYVKHPYNLPKFMDVFTWSLPFVGEKVSEMLLAVLNICSEEELQEEAASAKITTIDSEKETTNESLASVLNTGEDVTEEKLKLQTKSRLRKKIIAISKISKMYSLLKEESMSIQQLRDLNGGVLPKGSLYGDKEDLLNSINTFKKSKELDAINERLPPNLKEEHVLQKLKELNNSASVIGNHDDLQHNIIAMLLDDEEKSTN